MKKLQLLFLHNTKVFYAILLFSATWHLWSLQYSPLPWFDETFFASITNSLLNGKGFSLEVCPIQTKGKEVLIYGPVYFLLTGISIKIAGIGIFQFRIISLLFGALSIWAFSKILRIHKIHSSIFRWIIFILAFDVILIQNSHSGRMDMVALFFSLIAWWAWIHPQKSYSKIIIMALAGIIAILTTPRIAVIIFPLFMYALIKLLIEKKWVYAFSITLIPIFLYSIWIFYAFGSYLGFIEYYFLPGKSGPDSSLATSFIGGNFSIPFYQWPVIITSLISAYIIIKNKKDLLNLLLIALPLIVFYALIKDTGAYSALIMPFWYLIIAIASSIIIAEKRIVAKFQFLGLVVISLVNIGIFSLKAITIIGSLPQRNPKPLQEWVTRNIPENSKIVGDDRFFYACLKQKCEFQYIERTGNHSERAKYHSTEFQPDYLFISEQTSQNIIKEYEKEFLFLDTIKYTPPSGIPIVNKIVQMLPMTIKSSYKGTLIKVKSKQ